MIDRKRYAITSWIYLRLLGLIYIFAFASFAVQATGLLGANGILPAQELLGHVNGMFGGAPILSMPTVFWFDCSDQALQSVPWLGAFCGLLIACDILTFPALFVCWFLYLSIVTVGGDFMSFQWDTLLLEAGFISIFLGRWHLVPQAPSRHEPPVTILWLLRFLLFRLMYCSGLCKLASHDPTWRDLSAMSYHYLTQPLPLPSSWFLYKLPLWFHQLETVCVFLIEIVVPFLIPFPRSIRLTACALLAFFQFLIAASGNYAFFNWLTLALSLTLMDDAAWRSLLPRSGRKFVSLESPRLKDWVVAEALALPAALSLLLLSGSYFMCQLGLRRLVPPAAQESLSLSSPFNIVNGYGLFAVMTTTRPEILIEGSKDGEKWLAYEFKWKPGDLTRSLPVVAPHQPRLDWQLWFAALSDDVPSWFVNFMQRLLEGKPEVLALVEKNPFPDGPPRFVRATRYLYTFSDFGELVSERKWWRREFKDEYFVPVSIPH